MNALCDETELDVLAQSHSHSPAVAAGIRGDGRSVDGRVGRSVIGSSSHITAPSTGHPVNPGSQPAKSLATRPLPQIRSPSSPSRCQRMPTPRHRCQPIQVLDDGNVPYKHQARSLAHRVCSNLREGYTYFTTAVRPSASQGWRWTPLATSTSPTAATTGRTIHRWGKTVAVVIGCRSRANCVASSPVIALASACVDGANALAATG